MFYFAGLIPISVKKKSFSFKELTREAKQSFFKYIWFTIVLVVFLSGLFLLLIIPGIIFFFYWAVAVYAFFDKKEGIIKSLKYSKLLIKGRWWRVVGYTILLF